MHGHDLFSNSVVPKSRLCQSKLTICTSPELPTEYFRHLQWAHLAAGGAGGGMRWPNRSPHVLTPGMRR
ncbi:MAG: hypothetical protein E5Y81_12695, partial [Mesorhizobium sp.]